jgi:hypothetical protein
MRNSEDWPKCHGGTDTTNLVPTGTLIVGRGRTWLSVREGASGVGAVTVVVTGAYSIGDRSPRLSLGGVLGHSAPVDAETPGHLGLLAGRRIP